MCRSVCMCVYVPGTNKSVKDAEQLKCCSGSCKSINYMPIVLKCLASLSLEEKRASFQNHIFKDID